MHDCKMEEVAPTHTRSSAVPPSPTTRRLEDGGSSTTASHPLERGSVFTSTKEGSSTSQSKNATASDQHGPAAAAAAAPVQVVSHDMPDAADTAGMGAGGLGPQEQQRPLLSMILDVLEPRLSNADLEVWFTEVARELIRRTSVGTVLAALAAVVIAHEQAAQQPLQHEDHEQDKTVQHTLDA